MYGIAGLLAGRTLVDRYRIDAVVGRGGMGAVYRATDERLGREVAVKVITVAAADADAHQRLRARFQREARAAAALHHPNVVQVYDFGTDPVLQLDFLVMELLRGEDLATRLSRKGPPAVPAALEILCQAARGLGAGHRAGLVHRDVKPGNLFLEPGDRIGELHVKVLDFGIADVTGDEGNTVTHLTVVGRSPYSPAYASPEQARGERSLPPATDVFSLGAVGFHLLTGERAFDAHDPREMLVQLSASLANTLPRVRGLDPGARAVLRRALAPDARDRYPTAADFARALEPLVGGRGAAPEEMDTELPAAPRADPAAQDHTRLLEEDLGEGTRLQTRPPGGPRPGEARDRAGMPQGIGAPQHPARPQPQGGWLRRTARTTWAWLVTGTASVAFAGSWFVATTGLQDGEPDRVYLGAAAGALFTPWAIHRMARRPGSLRFAVLASMSSSVAVAVLLRDQGIEQLAAGLFAVQVAASLLAQWLTRPREQEGDDSLLD